MSVEERPAAGGRPPGEGKDEAELRSRAVKRIERKNGFWTHLLIYFAVNAFLVVIWWWTDAPVFWPVFPLVGWGIGVAANAWDAFRPDAASEQRIAKEIGRMRR
jgi:hypothetical protein